MLRVGPRSVITIIAVITLCTCIDPYTPRLNGYESLLVVDGLITDENAPCTVRLSRTLQEQDASPVMVNDAKVFISDDAGGKSTLEAAGEGIYKTNTTEIRGITGRTYTLHIITAQGTEYESDPCIMLPVPPIDNVYFARDQKLVQNGTEIIEGVGIFLDSKNVSINSFFRWDFEETWKFKVPNPKKYNYINDSIILPVSRINEYCWKTRTSNQVLIKTIGSEGGSINQEPIYFIDPKKSERLLLQYSILVKQYSISKREYDFWNNMKQINESGGNIYSTQPFPIISNIHNVNNSAEQVLGYFQVSAVTQKRKNIPFSEISTLNLPYFNYPCTRIEMAPKDYPRSPYSDPLTFDELYDMYCKTSDYYFVEPIYSPGTSVLEKLVFTKPECADCELTGTSVKPDFWTDLN